MTRAPAATLLAAVALLLTGCSAAAPVPAPSSTAPASAEPAPTPTPTPDPVEALSLEQRVGQLFMVGTPADAASPVSLSAVGDRHVGAIFLHGRSQAGTAGTAAVVARFTGLAASATDVPLWVATDQEGGEVQVLRGSGFDDMPYGIRQADRPDAELRTDAERWGGQLRAAGVTMNLAPVADIVSSAETRFDNPPIGGLGRQYGYDLATVAAKAGAFADGMRAAGVMPTLKHFPGLGRVSANTDFAARVVDDVVAADSPDVAVYAELIADGPAVVMLSTAVYERIDPATPAAFSAPVLDVLRTRVGFDGVAITDDLSAAAAAQAWSPADRAVLAVSAGVDVVLASADPGVLAEMYDAVLSRAQADPVFAERVTASASRVLAAKAALSGRTGVRP